MPKHADYFETQAYQQLLGQIKPLLEEEFSQGVVDLNALRLKNYWQIGRRLIRLQARLPALRSLSQSSPALQRLAQDLKIGPAVLYRMLLFYRTWPDQTPLPPDGPALSWAHHFELLSLESEAARRYYHDEALAQGWSRNTLRQALRLKLYEQVQQTGRHGKIPKVATPFYTYAAQVLRVLDGDTLAVQVDLGFHLSFTPILRLRGVNTPELGQDPTGRAEKAKARLEAIVGAVPRVVMKSYKTDVYGRYLADLYYHPTLKEKEEILAKGIFLNQQILDEGLGDWMVM